MHENRKIAEWVLALDLAGSCYGEDSLRKSLPGLRLTAKTELTPLHGWAQCLLGTVIGRLDALMDQEGEKVIPVLERPAGTCAYLRIGAVLVQETVPFHPGSHQLGCPQELLPIDETLAEGVPTAEDVADLLEHISGKQVGMRACPAFFQILELPDQMRPA